MDRPDVVRIRETVQETPSIKTFILDKKVANALPGQFVMAWVPGVDEKPISISYFNPLGLTVQKRGPATERMHSMKEGDLLGVRGPYGKGFSLEARRALIVGGGCGVAPLGLLAETLDARGAEVTTVIGARTASELLFVKRAEKLGETIVTTDDGTSGRKGFVTNVVEELLKSKKYDKIYACGPERMLARLVPICEGTPFEASMERHMKCGIGICGSCATDPSGLRVCRDGPVFDSGTLRKLGEFGNYRRGPTGAKCGLD